jgi:hypothetical protein
MSNRENQQHSYSVKKRIRSKESTEKKRKAIYRHSQYMRTIEDYEINQAIDTMKSIFLKRDCK